MRRKRIGAVMFLAVVAAMFALLLGAPGRAAVLRVPEEYSTIQGGVDAAGDADTVSVAAGTYVGTGNRDIEIVGKSLLLKSREGWENTVIDCQHIGRAFHLDGWGSAPSIEGFTVKDGAALAGFGGAVYSVLASPVFRDCRFVENEAGVGGAVALHYSATFERCMFLGNASESWDGGGAVYAGAGSTTFDACLFAGNYTPGAGAAIRTNGGADIALTECTISGNYSGSQGGAVFAVGGTITLDRSISWGNCPDEIYMLTGGLTLRCSDVDLSGIVADELIIDDVIDTDPLFCDPQPCSWGYLPGDYSLRSDSPCLPGGNPCGVRLGALDEGCVGPGGTGVCCFTDGSCAVETEPECLGHGGSFDGELSSCDPNPCNPTPVERTSWGRIKAQYRGEAR